jgi:hypothetical protein
MQESASRRTILSSLMLAAVLGLNGCSACTSANLQGTYTDSSGTMKIELKSGGQATFAALNDTTACTYKTDGKQLTVSCENQTLSFTIQDEGTLMPPVGSQIGPLKKTKS